jgi:hypothetical protein
MNLEEKTVETDIDDGTESDTTIEPQDDVIEEKLQEIETPVEVKEEKPEPIKKVKKRMGRPPKSLEEKLAKQVVIKEKIVYMVQNTDGSFDKVKNPKLTVTDVKKANLKKEKEMKEIELGKALQTRKNGKIDKRSENKRTPAQIAATERMIAANKKKREAKNQQKKKETKEIVKETVKESVREVVQEPFYKPKEVVPPKPIDPYADLIF